MRRSFGVIVLALLALATAAYGSSAAAESDTLKSAAASRGLLLATNTDKPVNSYEAPYGATIAREFNALSTTASMWMIVHPERDRWDFEFLDSVVAFGAENGLKVIGTPILWGASGIDETGKENWNDYDPTYLNDNLTADEARQIMRDHITTLVSRYRGKVHEWVVANEVLDATSPTGFRQDIFARKLGTKAYLTEAFKLVHELDPDAVLILNDGGIHGPGAAADRFYELVRDLLQNGAPINAVGFQTHWTNFETMPSFTQMETNLKRFADLGVEIRLTEVDVMVGHLPLSDRDEWQKTTYQGIVATCLKITACKGITFWGFTDKHNWWIDEIGYEDEQPLLFDSEYQKKPAYDGVFEVLRGAF